MSHSRKRIAITAGALLCVLAAAGVSKPGRTTLGRVYSMLRSSGSSPVPMPPPQPDVENRARARHGWDTAPPTWVMRGTIAFFDPSGALARRANLTVYRRYPDQIRVDIEHQGLIQAQGFDSGDGWQARANNLTESDKRDIRGWLRVWPERLFLVRDAGAAYRETGRRLEDTMPAGGVRPPPQFRPARDLDQLEVEDTISFGPGAGASRKQDRRLITYLVDAQSSIVNSAMWLEPDDPTKSIDDPNTAVKQVIVGFGKWRRIGGLLTAFEITHWLGGTVDFRIEVTEVLANQSLATTVFRDPSK